MTNKKNFILLTGTVLFFVIAIFLNIYMDFGFHIQSLLETRTETQEFIKDHQFFSIYLFAFILSSSVYVFFLGFGSIPTFLSILLFDPWIAYIACVISKSFGSVFGIVFLKKVLDVERIRKRIKFLNIKKVMKLDFLVVCFLRLIPGIPLQICNSLISLLNARFISVITGSILGFGISNYIFIFFLDGSLNFINEAISGNVNLGSDYIFLLVIFIIMIFSSLRIKRILKR